MNFFIILKYKMLMRNMFKRFKVKPINDNTNSIIIDTNNFTYENIIAIINKLDINNTCLLKIIDNLKSVNFIDNKTFKKLSIDHIIWINKDKNMSIKINNIFKTNNNHYYEFDLDTFDRLSNIKC